MASQCAFDSTTYLPGGKSGFSGWCVRCLLNRSRVFPPRSVKASATAQVLAAAGINSSSASGTMPEAAFFEARVTQKLKDEPSAGAWNLTVVAASGGQTLIGSTRPGATVVWFFTPLATASKAGAHAQKVEPSAGAWNLTVVAASGR